MTTDLAPLNLVAVNRVHSLTQPAADYLLVLLAAHLLFLRLADEAEAIAS